MSPSDSKSSPPSYSQIPASREKLAPTAPIINNRIAGTVQTTSIKDGYVDYLKIVRESPTSYCLSLTVDPTPIYRIEIPSDSSKIGDIQVYLASDNTLLAVAAARLACNPKKKDEPAAMICTSEPFLPDAKWRPLTGRPLSVLEDKYRSSIPIITIPGIEPQPQEFEWKTHAVYSPFVRLWWKGPLPMVPSSGFVHDRRGSEYVFASIERKSTENGERVIEIRRGGGLEFELSVIVELFVISHFEKINQSLGFEERLF